MPAFHKLTEAGLYREAEKLRSYLRAAYSTAKKARTNAGMYSFKGFAIRTNPLAELARPERPKGTGTGTPSKWALSADQLAHYWRRISEDKTPHGALLRFHLLTGGQRIEQLARLEREHYDADTKTILLLDGKGRRKEVFRHTVPLIPAAVAALEDMSQGGQYLFSVTGGRTPVDDRTVWEAVAKHAKAMLDAGEVDRLFSPGAIRKTVETRLAAGGTPDEALARLLSHGLGSVQARHYNEHKYADEKRAALETLYRLATRATANVTPIKRRNESGKRR
jgi:integrase